MNETIWRDSYPQLHAQARRLVYQLQVADWKGQEEDVAWDIVQESLRKALEYVQKTERGEREPVQSLAALVSTIAQNYGRDLRRRERRLQREATMLETAVSSEANFSEIAIENAYQENVFRKLAHEIARFPKKQRQALLGDLALRMSFEGSPSILQKAFQAEGIHLEEYRSNARPETERERNRNAALLNHAYKRLQGLEEVRKILA